METINDRIKIARKVLKLNQTEFGQKIGVSQTAIGQYEKGTRNITDRIIIQICQTYNVSEQWLRTGEGEMMAVSSDTVFDEFAQHYALTPREQATARFLLTLSREERAAVLSYVKRLAAEITKAES